MRGMRLSDRLPRRIVASWVTEPTGCPVPRRMCSTPAMKVEDTAPRAHQKDPQLPSRRPDARRAGRHEVLGLQADALLNGELHEPLVPL